MLDDPTESELMRLTREVWIHRGSNKISSIDFSHRNSSENLGDSSRGPLIESLEKEQDIQAVVKVFENMNQKAQDEYSAMLTNRNVTLIATGGSKTPELVLTGNPSLQQSTIQVKHLNQPVQTKMIRS